MKRYSIIILLLFFSIRPTFSQEKTREIIQITPRERREYLEEVKKYITESYYDILSEAVADIDIHGNIIDYLMADGGTRYKPEFGIIDESNRFLSPSQYLMKLHSTFGGNRLKEDLDFVVSNLELSQNFYEYGLRGCYVSAEYDLEVRNQSRSFTKHRCRMYCLFPNRLFKKEIRTLQVEPVENLLSKDSEKHVVQQNKESHAKMLSTDTKHNDAESQFDLGVRCYKGEGVVQNYESAVDFFRRAAAQGHVQAMAYLGKCYLFGDGVTRDFEESAKWYRKAAEQGDVVSQYTVGILYSIVWELREHQNEAIKWIRTAAEQGNVVAQVELGRWYENGVGVSKDYREAVRWYRKAAEQEDGTARYYLAYCYEWGQGVQKDLKEAVALYHASANIGCLEALYALGRLYFHRNVHIRNYTIPVDLKKKATQGNALAQLKFADHYFCGIGTSADLTEAAKWYRKAADQGNAEAQYQLGFLYKFGEGVVEDQNESLKWYRKAAEQGNANARTIRFGHLLLCWFCCRQRLSGGFQMVPKIYRTGFKSAKCSNILS